MTDCLWFVGYYGLEDRGIEVTEDSEPGTGFLSDLCIKWENSADISGTGVRPVIVRIGEFQLKLCINPMVTSLFYLLANS